MRRGRSSEPHEELAPRPPPRGHQSGVVRKDELDPERTAGPPPWAVVRAYLSRGDHRAWVEAHAARSPAFAEVLAALRHDDEERRQATPRGRR
jgi:hypothetical protein